MLQLTYDEFDKKKEKIDSINLEPYFPTLEELDLFENDPSRWLWFVLYLYENNPEPSNNFEHYSKKNMLLFINKHLQLVDAQANI